MKYILTEKLKAEIEKRQEARQDIRDSASWENEYWPESDFCTRDDEDDAILSIIASLQQEQPCLPFNVDEAAENYYEQDCPYPGEARVVNNEHDVWFPSQAIEDAFIAGAKWQQEKDERIYRDFFDARNQGDASLLDLLAYQEGHRDGMAEQKEQMMKEAVEGEVIKTDKHTSVRYKSFYGTDRYFYGIADKQFKPGDKVRIIIVKP